MIKVILRRMTVIALLIPCSCFAANRYVRAGATGTGSGSDWTNAYPTLPSPLTRGETYYIADGTYGGYNFDTAISGTTPITIKKATESDHGTNTGWNSSYGDGQAVFTDTMRFMTSYWVFDGVTGGGPGRWDTEFGFRIVRRGGGPTKCFHIQGASTSTIVTNITIQHVDAENSGEDVTGNADNFYVINADDITVRYVWVHNTNRTNFLLDKSKRLLLEYSLISERHSIDGTHGEHMSINNSGLAAGTIIRHNLFRNSTNTGTIVIKDSVQSGFEIYGNVFYTTNRSRYYNTNGIITDTSGDSTTNVKIYNNTFLPIPKGSGSGDVPTVSFQVSTGNEFKNNIVFNKGGFGGVATRQYNLYDESTYAGETGGQRWTGSEAGLFINPSGHDYRLRTATNSGTLLSSLLSSVLSIMYQTDMTGAARGADGNWDRGAYEFSSGAEAPPAPPTNLISADR